MDHITVDERTLDCLRNLTKEVEIRDPKGNVMGLYRPITDQELYREALELFPLEENETIEQEGGPLHTFEQVWEHIREAEKRQR